MRDRETDSWWSIMTSRAIGGEMEGAELLEMPVGTRTTFGEWAETHPQTTVLSIDGEEHREDSHYDAYFASPDTFRGLQVADDRLEAKTPIFAFFVDGRPYAAPHEALAGGKLFELADGSTVLLHRHKGASMFVSTRAYTVSASALETTRKPRALLEQADSTAALAHLEGIDTFWYNWAAVNEETRILP